MAYPLPRFSGSPSTPQHIKGMDVPRRSGHSSRQGLPVLRITVLFLAACAALIYLLECYRANVNFKQTDRIPFPEGQVQDYLNHFEGRQDCGLSSEEIYVPPPVIPKDGTKGLQYCKNRASVLEAMSGGGRHGFDAPFYPKGCHYRWYSTTEICMILDRFDAIIFVGDALLRNVYAAFNILLRENVALGSLKQWEMTDSESHSCRCENQFIKTDCTKFAITDSEEVKANDAGNGHKSPYLCDRVPHTFLPITTSPAADPLRAKFDTLVSLDLDSYKPIPVIHSLSLSTSLSWPSTTASMDEWLALADAAQRNIPFLWLGPVAAGHLKPPGKILAEGNNALWHFTAEMAKEARAREMDVLGLYNLTLQAGSWDGSGYGEAVALVQAMMLINWLSRLEST